MSIKQLLGRLRSNIWMVEISIFMFAYSLFVEMNDLDDEFIHFSKSFSSEFIINNVGLLFFLTGVVTFVASCMKKSSLGVYLATLGLTTLAAFSRIGAYQQGTVETDVWSIVIVWVHIIVLQMVLLFCYPARDNRRVIKEMINDEL